jgi:hypothetical protein
MVSLRHDLDWHNDKILVSYTLPVIYLILATKEDVLGMETI